MPFSHPKLWARLVFLICILGAPAIALCESTEDDPDSKVVELEPYVVSEEPLGWLGLKRSTIGMSFGKLVTFRKAIRWVRIDELHPNSPGVKAGILNGDFINTVDGRKITDFSVKELKAFGGDLEVGRKISIEVYRPATKETFTIELRVAARRAEPKS